MIYQFWPKRVYIEEGALEYPRGRRIKEQFESEGIPIHMIATHQRVTGIPGETRAEGYKEAKRTLVVGVRKSKAFQTCKPSAHYQLPLSTSCPGLCQYCYLNTTLGNKPYIRVYVNIEDILERAKQYIREREPELTVFEGAATSDPLPVEPYTGNLQRSIEFFAQEPQGHFRFVTKFTNVASLLNIEHNRRTTIRFSLNTDKIIRLYEGGTPSLAERIQASRKVFEANYPIGFLIAPIIYDPDYQASYRDLFRKIRAALGSLAEEPIPFELITHRFTPKAKERINDIFPENRLSMEVSERQFKYGQFGYGKYLYTKEQMAELKQFFEEEIANYFPSAEISYFV